MCSGRHSSRGAKRLQVTMLPCLSHILCVCFSSHPLSFHLNPGSSAWPERTRAACSWPTQFVVLLRRAMLGQLRNPTDTTSRLFLSTWVGVLAGESYCDSPMPCLTHHAAPSSPPGSASWPVRHPVTHPCPVLLIMQLLPLHLGRRPGRCATPQHPCPAQLTMHAAPSRPSFSAAWPLYTFAGPSRKCFPM